MAEARGLTPGKARGLATASTADGIFAVLAIDHRDSLRVVLDPEDPSRVPAADITALKLDLLRGLGPGASAAMLEPEYSAAQAIVSGALPGSVVGILHLTGRRINVQRAVKNVVVVGHCAGGIAEQQINA